MKSIIHSVINGFDGPALGALFSLPRGNIADITSESTYCLLIPRNDNQAGPVPISWKLIHDWCAAYRCDDEMEEDVIHHVMKMDEAQREWMKKRKTLGSKDGHQPPQPAHPKAARKNRRGR